jgi:hypothetical protein
LSHEESDFSGFHVSELGLASRLVLDDVEEEDEAAGEGTY